MTMSKYKVYAYPGHGGKDPGAVSDGFKEANWTLDVGIGFRDYLVTNYENVEVKLGRTTDVYKSPTDYSKEVNTWGADVAVDFHFNAGGGDGCEAWCSKGSTRAANLAKAILKEVEKLGQNVHGSEIKTRTTSSGADYYAFNRIPNCASPIIEFAFIDNATDRKIADTKAERIKLGEAAARGVANYLGLKKKGSTTTMTKKMTSNKLIEAVHDENGKVKGGKAGDQTGDEVRVTKYRYFGQQYIFRPKNKILAIIMAALCEYWALNSHVGYDQTSGQRNGLWDILASNDWKSFRITKDTETVCSNLIECAMKFCGYDVPKNMLSGKLITWLKEHSKDFEMIRDYDALHYGIGTKTGDIVIKDGHVGIVM